MKVKLERINNPILGKAVRLVNEVGSVLLIPDMPDELIANLIEFFGATYERPGPKE